jgi:hypothetical protein
MVNMNLDEKIDEILIKNAEAGIEENWESWSDKTIADIVRAIAKDFKESPTRNGHFLVGAALLLLGVLIAEGKKEVSVTFAKHKLYIKLSKRWWK